MTVPIFAVGASATPEMYGQIPMEYDCVLHGLCEGLGLKYVSILTDSPFNLVRFLIEGLSDETEPAIRGFMSGLDAEEYPAPDIFDLMAGSTYIAA